MNRDDIIRMADESGLDHMPGWLTLPAVLANLERFANLVAAAEREACARVCDEFSDPIAKGYLRNVAVKIKAAIRARGNET